MTDHGSDRGDHDAVAADVGDDQARRGDAIAGRAKAAEGPVLGTRDLDPGNMPPETETVAHPLIESSLVGGGGAAAAAPRTNDGMEETWGEADADGAAAGDAAAPEDDATTMSGTIDAAPDAVNRPVWGAATVPAATASPATDRSPGTRETSGSSLPPARGPVSDPAPVRRGGFWPLALGGVVAAGLGAGAAVLVLPQIAPRPTSQIDPQPADPTPAIKEAAGDAARAAVDGLSQQLIDDARRAGAEAGTAAGTQAAQAAIDAAPAAASGSAPQTAANDPAQLEDQAQRIAALEAKVADLGTAKAQPAQPGPTPSQADAPASAAEPTGTGTATAPAAPDPDLARLRSRLEEQAQQLASLAARPTLDPATADSLRQLGEDAAATRQAIDATAQRVQAQLKEIEGKADSLDQQVAETAKRAENAATLAAVEATLTQGGDGTAAAARLTEAGIQPPAALTVPVPALRTLQTDFPQAARVALAAALRADGAGSTGGRGVMNFLRAQTGARSVTPREGGDADAVLSRAGAAVGRGDIAAALTEIESLPAAARQAMSGWIEPASAWAAAHDALDAIKTTTP